ncbi:MAG TPA: IS1634 family transposase [Candidatus Babeliales bacterium]|nr:IS1634 family transposase [Candidatus Babeliales bacterium]
MFVRTKKSLKTNNTAIQIVENTRFDGTTKQHVIRHIGTASTEEDINSLKQTAETVKNELESKNLYQSKINVTSQYGKSTGKLKPVSDKETTHIAKLEETNRSILGIHDVYGYIYDLLQFTNLFSSPARREHSAKILREIVLCRIAYPSSKRGAVEKLRDAFGISLNLDHVYQMMDKIDEAFCERIQQRSLLATLRLTGEKLKILFYDATTLYFESFTEDDLKQNGYSKDMKFNQPQVLLALFVTTGGLPVGYELFPGATYEGHTLKPILEKLKNRYQIDEMIFVADRGMLSDDNLVYLGENNIPYIVGARLRSLSKSKQKEILAWGAKVKKIEQEKQNKNTQGINAETENVGYTSSIEINASKHVILSYQKKRAEKDRYDREKSILKLQQKLSKSSNPKNVISNYGYQKYLLIDGEATLRINEEKLNGESQWDGLSGVYTNQKDLDSTEILNHYRSLWQIEESFRINKHDLSIRPIYHWTPHRIKAHIAISFMAFACVRHLEYRVKMQYKKLSPEVIRQELLKVQAGIIKDNATGKKYLLPTKITQEAKHLYRVIGVKPPDQIQAIL